MWNIRPKHIVYNNVLYLQRICLDICTSYALDSGHFEKETPQRRGCKIQSQRFTLRFQVYKKEISESHNWLRSLTSRECGALSAHAAAPRYTVCASKRTRLRQPPVKFAVLQVLIWEQHIYYNTTLLPVTARLAFTSPD